MNVLIVARTRMGGDSRCIGGLTQDGDSVRLLTAAGGNHHANAPFRTGQIWDLTYARSPQLIPPHVEDVRVTAQQYVEDQDNLHAHLLGRVTPWRGGIDQLFGRLVRFTGGGSGYVCERIGVPDRSTGYWIPDCDLHLRSDGKHYDYGAGSPRQGLSYVGEEQAVPSITAGTLVRVSLARWWKPVDAEDDFEERCYLQLSGWF